MQCPAHHADDVHLRLGALNSAARAGRSGRAADARSHRTAPRTSDGRPRGQRRASLESRRSRNQERLCRNQDRRSRTERVTLSPRVSLSIAKPSLSFGDDALRARERRFEEERRSRKTERRSDDGEGVTFGDRPSLSTIERHCRRESRVRETKRRSIDSRRTFLDARAPSSTPSMLFRAQFVIRETKWRARDSSVEAIESICLVIAERERRLSIVPRHRRKRATAIDSASSSPKESDGHR